MNQEVFSRLRRLGVVKGMDKMQPGRPKRPLSGSERAVPLKRPPTGYNGEPQPLEKLLPALSLVETAEGACYALDHVFPSSYRHGSEPLAAFPETELTSAAIFCDDERLETLDFRDFLFLDTETTGLGGAGTLPFMVGVAFFEGEALVTRQFFLRDHGDEPAMLLLLEALLGERAGLITFNGGSFDLPLLEGRFVLNRLLSDLRERPHLDLLPPSRRLWRLRLSSCALSSLEQQLLGLERTQEDVPGWLIPSIYNEYLRNGDGRELTRVFYHNRIDLLSMVTLAARVVRQFSEPQPGDHPIDLLGLGRWQIELGLMEEAEQNLRRAAAPEMPTPLYRDALTRLAYLLKRTERREEALDVWRQLACTSFDDVTAHVELAKHFEWQSKDLHRAYRWTEEALALAEVEKERDALAHRLQRLRRKIAQHVGADE